jgi:multiple sugar transport system permease protein
MSDQSQALAAPATAGDSRLARLRRWARRRDLSGYLFLLPSFTIITMFSLIPIFFAVGLSLLRWDMIGEPQFVGLRHYIRLHQDPLFWKSLFNTVYYTIGAVPLGLFTALAVALLLNSKIRGIGLYRTIYFIPVITSLNAVAIVWKWIYHPNYGLLNKLIGLIGIDPQLWLLDPKLAMPSIIIMSVWKNLGYNVIIFLNGLMNIPSYLYEAAEVDGASRWHRFRHITWPLLSPVTYFILIMSTIASFRVFAQIYMMTPTGGPMNSTTVVVYYLYNLAFSDMRFGYASAMAFELFLIIFVMTLIQRRVAERRVHYQ